MLKKLLKYDFKAVFKYWWIAAVISLMLSGAGGFCYQIVTTSRALPEVIIMLATLALVLIVISVAVFSLLSTIIIAGRFYKNLFTDEGYLTFTLPVTRGQLLNSKLLVGMLAMVLTGLLCCVDFLLMFDGIEFLKDFWESLKEGWQEIGGWLIVYIVELLLIMLLGTLFSMQFLNCCITFGCIVAKKAKIVASIAIYYGANGAFSLVLSILYTFGLISLSDWLSGVQINDQNIALLLTAFMVFGVIAILGLFCSMLYTLQYWMLDRKLNLP